MTRIDEQSRRRANHAADVPVEMDDGQTWFLPRPRIRLRARKIDGAIQPVSEHSFGPEYLDLVETYQETQKDESDGSFERWISSWLALAIALLQRNYDLTFEEAAELFHFDIGVEPDPKVKERQELIQKTALGLSAKKTLPDGSEPI